MKNPYQTICNKTGKECEHKHCICFTCIEAMEYPEKCKLICDYRFVCSKELNEKS